jgi:hypothetical protein
MKTKISELTQDCIICKENSEGKILFSTNVEKYFELGSFDVSSTKIYFMKDSSVKTESAEKDSETYSLIKNFPNIIMYGSKEQFRNALYILLTECNKEQTNLLIETMNNWAKENKNKEIETKMSEEEYSEAICDVCKSLIGEPYEI